MSVQKKITLGSLYIVAFFKTMFDGEKYGDYRGRDFYKTLYK